jgi:hypothetical protein
VSTPPHTHISGGGGGDDDDDDVGKFPILYSGESSILVFSEMFSWHTLICN